MNQPLRLGLLEQFGRLAFGEACIDCSLCDMQDRRGRWADERLDKPSGVPGWLLGGRCLRRWRLRRLLALIGKILDSHHDRVRQRWLAGGDLFDVELHKCGLPIGNLTSQFLANVYLDSLDHFVKHGLRVKGYVRYLDDFVLFGDDRRVLKEHGRRVKEKLAELHLRMHPDKYRLVPTHCGLDFVGFVVRADGRIRVRTATARRFQQRFHAMRWEVK